MPKLSFLTHAKKFTKEDGKRCHGLFWEQIGKAFLGCYHSVVYNEETLETIYVSTNRGFVKVIMAESFKME